MDAQGAARLGLEALYLAGLLSLPMLAALVLAGVVNAAGQSVLGLRDAAIGAGPRLLLVGAAVALAAPWMADSVVTFTTHLWQLFPA